MIRQQDIVEALESLVDRSTLLDVMTALELVCYEKAEHIHANWQDENMAKVWQNAGKSIYKATAKIETLGI